MSLGPSDTIAPCCPGGADDSISAGPVGSTTVADHTDICLAPATELAARIRGRDVSPVEVLHAFRALIETRDRAIGAYVTLDDGAEDAARSAERALTRGATVGPLHGVPVAIKDLDLTAGLRTTFGSAARATYVPTEDAVVVERLKAAGAIVVGKTNTPEFGHSATTDNKVHGPTSTPFALGFNAGGSSGGSAAAVAAGMCSMAQGSDGGGSIRIPAACCGVYGLKPSWGRVPNKVRPGGFFHTPFTHIGPLTRTVRDAAVMLDVMAGPHPADPFSLPMHSGDLAASGESSVNGLRVGYAPEFDVFTIDADVRERTDAAVTVLETLGARVELTRVGMPASREALTDLWLQQAAVLNASLADQLRAEGVDLLADEDSLTPEFAASIRSGCQLTAVAYRRGDVLRTKVFDALQAFFERYDVLVTATTAVAGVANDPHGITYGPRQIAGVAVDRVIGWVLTHPINFAGHPAASLPAGTTAEGLPVGMQVVAPRFRDDRVLAVSAAYERARPWHDAYAEL